LFISYDRKKREQASVQGESGGPGESWFLKESKKGTRVNPKEKTLTIITEWG